MERFDILLASGLITQEIADQVSKAETFMKSRFKADDPLEMFLTHYALALERSRKEETISALSSTAIDEIKNAREYGEACETLEKLEEMTHSSLSETENQFMILHLINLITLNRN